jgi:hypothetical protein
MQDRHHQLCTSAVLHPPCSSGRTHAPGSEPLLFTVPFYRIHRCSSGGPRRKNKLGSEVIKNYNRLRTQANEVIPVAVWVCGRPFAGTVGSNPAGRNECLSSGRCVLSSRGLCDGPIPSTEESYRVCVTECDHV